MTRDPKIDHPSLREYERQQREFADKVYAHLRTNQQRLQNLSDALVDDIMELSDEEVLQEFKEDHGNPEQHAAEMRRLVEKAVKQAKQEQP